MIAIKVDLTAATPEEAAAYAASKTRLFLLYATPVDLKGSELTITLDSGSHFSGGLTETETRTGVNNPSGLPKLPEQSPAHAMGLIRNFAQGQIV